MIRETSKKCTIPAGHVLEYDGVEVQEHHIEGNTWSITAKLKGSHVVQVIKEQDGTRPGSITVIVPNTPPTLDTTVAQSSVATLIATAPTTNSIDPGMHFDDADTGDQVGEPPRGNFRFRIFEKPDEVLIRTHRGFIAVREGDAAPYTYNSRLNSAEFVTQAIILKNPNPLPNTGGIDTGRTYEIRVSAYDGDNAQSDSPVTLRFNTENPDPQEYTLKKSGTTSYKRPRIGNRIGVLHTVKLSAFGDEDVVDYNFLDFITDTKITEKIKETDNTYTGGDVGEVTCTAEDADSSGEVTSLPDDSVRGTGCWSRTISGSEASIGTFIPKDPPDNPDAPADADESKITFMLGTDRRLDDASNVTITIRYWVVARASNSAATPPVEVKIVEVGRRSLTLDIHRCVEFSDCP